MKRFKIGLLLAAALMALLAGCNFLVDGSEPEISFVSPNSGTVSPQSTEVIVIASDEDSGIASVKLFLNGQSVFTSNVEKQEDGSFSLTPVRLTYPWDASTASGEHTFVAEAKNGFGQTARTDPMTVVVTKPVDPDSPDLESPSVEWISPSDDDIVSGVVKLAARANDDKGVTRVEFYAGNTLLATDTDVPYSYDWDTEGADLGREDGPVTLTVKAYDAVGSDGEAGIATTVLNSGIPPTLEIITPTDDAEVGAKFTVLAEVTSGGEDFNWVVDDDHKLWTRVYDYRGELVTENFLTTNGSGNVADEPQDNVDFLGEVEVDLGEIPSDIYDVVLEGTVEVNGVEIKLKKRNSVKVVINSALPPALVVFTPAPPESGAIPVVGDVINVSGRVTDQTEDIEAIEVRMVCDSCDNGEPANKLLFYNGEGQYDLFSTGTLALDGTPYIFDSTEWNLRVVAIDKQASTDRNIIEIPITVDRSQDTTALRTALRTFDVVTETQQGATIIPKKATWTIDTSNLPNRAKLLLIVRKDGEIIRFIKGTVEKGETIVHPETFGETDIGQWTVEAVLQDTVTGAQLSKEGPSVGVENIDN